MKNLMLAKKAKKTKKNINMPLIKGLCKVEAVFSVVTSNFITARQAVTVPLKKDTVSAIFLDNPSVQYNTLHRT